MTITCTDLDQFMRVVRALVEMGLGFAADADKLSITLTGGF